MWKTDLHLWYIPLRYKKKDKQFEELEKEIESLAKLKLTIVLVEDYNIDIHTKIYDYFHM